MKTLERITETTDIETALFLMSHIDNPCSVKVDNRVVNIRDFYIRRAKEVLSRLKNPYARDLLQSKIEEYAPYLIRGSSQ